jgi:uncharacterized membrane protein
MSWKFFMPLILVICSNLIYHNTAKNTPSEANPFLSIGISYIISTIITFGLFFISGGNLAKDIQKLNWTSYILGIAIVGIELGYILMYRTGWKISSSSLIANICATTLLIFISIFWYKELLSLKQVLGIICCMVGLVLVK